jgi:hypothetical protein
VHRKFLCHYSPFFNAAFNGQFIEGTTQRLDFEANAYTFSVFINWIYTQRLSDGSQSTLATDCLVNLWLPDKFLIPDLQNECAEAFLFGLSRYRISPAQGNHIYENTSADSPLRFIFIDQYMRDLPTQLEMKAEMTNQDILLDITDALRTRPLARRKYLSLGEFQLHILFPTEILSGPWEGPVRIRYSIALQCQLTIYS